MKTRSCKILTAALLIIACCGFFQSGRAAEPRKITLAEALDLAFEQNTSHALFVWEQELLEKREELRKHPRITAQAEPGGVRNGEFAGPEGSISLSMPLGGHFSLEGTLRVGLDEQKVKFSPSGSLNLDYDFFALPETVKSELLAEQNRQAQSNSLVLQTVDLLVQLRQQLDYRKQEEGALRHLEDLLAAASLTPNYDDLELRQKFRAQTEALARTQEELEQLQLRLSVLLGEAEGVQYDPVITVEDFRLELNEDELKEEVFAASPQLREAQARLAAARQELELERKSRGWDLKVSGGVNLNQAGLEQTGSKPLNWHIGLTATKTLYPQSIVLEELELAAAQAEHALETQERALLAELRSVMQGVRSAAEMLQLKGEHLAEAREDLAFRQRQYAAGLATELQVQETFLSVQRAEDDYAHSKLLYAQSVLALWNLCGRDLRTLVFAVIN